MAYELSKYTALFSLGDSYWQSRHFCGICVFAVSQLQWTVMGVSTVALPY